MNKRDKLQIALSDGNLGGAREILSGRVKSSPFSTQLYEQFGVVLLQIGDYSEAGKFLFLSGVRRPEYDAAITLFVRRYSRAGWQSLVESFPRRVKRGTWRALPANVRAALEANGAPRQNDGQYIFKTLRAHPGPNQLLGIVAAVPGYSADGPARVGCRCVLLRARGGRLRGWTESGEQLEWSPAVS